MKLCLCLDLSYNTSTGNYSPHKDPRYKNKVYISATVKNDWPAMLSCQCMTHTVHSGRYCPSGSMWPNSISYQTIRLLTSWRFVTHDQITSGSFCLSNVSVTASKPAADCQQGSTTHTQPSLPPPLGTSMCSCLSLPWNKGDHSLLKLSSVSLGNKHSSLLRLWGWEIQVQASPFTIISTKNQKCVL